MGAILLTFVIHFLVFFLACYVVTEFGQNYLYDETTPAIGLKVALSAAVLAAVATWTKPSYDTMFTSDISWTVLLGIVAFAVFTLVLRFQPLHAAAIGILTAIIVAGLGTLASDSFRGTGAAVEREIARPGKPPRRSAGEFAKPTEPEKKAN